MKSTDDGQVTFATEGETAAYGVVAALAAQGGHHRGKSRTRGSWRPCLGEGKGVGEGKERIISIEALYGGERAAKGLV